jgi:hypothetical protein
MLMTWTGQHAARDPGGRSPQDRSDDQSADKPRQNPLSSLERLRHNQMILSLTRRGIKG